MFSFLFSTKVSLNKKNLKEAQPTISLSINHIAVKCKSTTFSIVTTL